MLQLSDTLNRWLPALLNALHQVPPDGLAGQRYGASVGLDSVMHTVVVAAPLRPLLGANESGFCASEGTDVYWWCG